MYGIEADIKSLGRKDVDGFFQALVQLLDNDLGREFLPFVKPRFQEKYGKHVCIVEVEPSPRPVYVRNGTDTEIYVRAGNTTRPLSLQAAHEYIGMHWQV